ncbi:hypothetical protein N9H64_02555, partial [Acidimicrobiia bacterium]|nr:hypothetical protein [Acidimicrobiia bacterium]
HNIERELFDNEKGRLKKILPSVQERLETLNDLKPQIDFLLDEPFMLNKEDWDSVNSNEGQEYLMAVREKIKNLDEFTVETIETLMRDELKIIGVKPKIGFQIVRVSVTGTKISPPLFESIFALGKNGALARLAETIEKL